MVDVVGWAERGGEARAFSVRVSTIRDRGGKVGNLLLVFHFSTASSSELWECGNLAWVWRDFQGAVERGGSLLLAFHAFHSPVISTALFCFSFFAFCLRVFATFLFCSSI